MANVEQQTLLSPPYSPEHTARNSVVRSDSQSSEPPIAPYMSPTTAEFPGPSIPSTPRDSTFVNENAAPLLAHPSQSALRDSSIPINKEADASLADEGRYTKRPFYKRPLFWLAAFIILAIVVLAVVLPVYFVVVKPRKDRNSGSPGGSSSGSGSSSGGGSGSLATFGGNGSVIVTADGSNFTYINPFGGYWVYDDKNPFNNSAQCNSWTPPLTEDWDWTHDRINGVNIGGLFVLEPFITPALYQATGAIDEWTLTTYLGGNGTLVQTMTDHYETFITEEDIAQIAGAGLNWIRVPIPFWAIDKWDNVGVDTQGNAVSEPFLQQVCWQYILRLIGWARKYGLRVNFDIHTAPGSQNGYNHSGKLGQVNFLNGPMGIANAERMLGYIRIFAEFISQPEYTSVIPLFGLVNEALINIIGDYELYSFYLKAHDMVRGITGVGEGHGPFLSIHDGFDGTAVWAGFFHGSDRIALDTHPYFAFDGQPNNAPIDIPAVGGDGSVMGGQWPKSACTGFGPGMNASREAFGVTFAGEWSNAFNDCGLFVNGVGNGPISQANCTLFSNAALWDDNVKAGVREYALASMDALGDWFFWTWKIGNSTAGYVEAPLWSYQLGLQMGFMPTNARAASGTCESLGVNFTPWNETFQSWQTGGAGAGTIAAASTSQYGIWPPTTIANVPAASIPYLPQYTATANIVTLPPDSALTSAAPKATIGNGWFDASDNAPIVTAISGCAYPDAWEALTMVFPTAGCGAQTPLAVGALPSATPTPAVRR